MEKDMYQYDIEFNINGVDYGCVAMLAEHGIIDDEHWSDLPDYMQEDTQPTFCDMEFTYWDDVVDDWLEVEPTKEMINRAIEILENVYWNSTYA